MVVAVHLAVAVAGLAGGAGAAGVPQLLLLIPSLVLVLVVQHSLEVHHGPGVPGLRIGDDTNKEQNTQVRKHGVGLQQFFAKQKRNFKNFIQFFCQSHKILPCEISQEVWLFLFANIHLLSRTIVLFCLVLLPNIIELVM